MKITDLELLVQQMTVGPWSLKRGNVGADHPLYVVTSEEYNWRAPTDADTAGVVALRNHAERLLAMWKAAKVVAAADWRSSVSEREHYARIDKVDTLRAALSTLEAE